MTDPSKVQGSNAERAEGGLNPEASFAELDGASSRRMAMEAQGIPGAGMRGQGGPSTGAGMASGAPAPIPGGKDGQAELRANVAEQLRGAPGGKGAIFGRDEYGER